MWLAGAAPVAWLAVRAVRGDLGANPIEEVLHRLGWWGLVFLCLTLAVTPVRRITRRPGLSRLRRPLGLIGFGYVALHFLAYLGLDQFFDWPYILEDVIERPYIIAGFSGFLILTVLAVTSTRGWIRRLGPRWRKLHRLLYVAVPLGVLHYYWQVKADTREPLVFAAVLGLLLAVRLLLARTGRRVLPDSRRSPMIRRTMRMGRAREA